MKIVNSPIMSEMLRDHEELAEGLKQKMVDRKVSMGKKILALRAKTRNIPWDKVRKHLFMSDDKIAECVRLVSDSK